MFSKFTKDCPIAFQSNYPLKLNLKYMRVFIGPYPCQQFEFSEFFIFTNLILTPKSVPGSLVSSAVGRGTCYLLLGVGMSGYLFCHVPPILDGSPIERFKRERYCGHFEF